MQVRRHFSRFWLDNRGIAMIEMAIFAPVLVSFILGAADLTRYVMISYKIDRLASVSANLISRMDSFKEIRFTELFTAAPQMAPYDFATKGTLILSGIKYDANLGKKVNWRRTGGGTLAQTSQVGTLNAVAVLPTGFTLGTTELLVVAEVFYQYSALFVPLLFPNQVFRRVSYFRAADNLF